MFRRVAGAAVTTLVVVAALGLVCWFVFQAVAGASLITFRTGSMSPTMPQGAVAVTVPVQADEIEVGDVVTVQRAGESMPVTHRVIEVGPVQERAANEADIRAAAPGSGPPDLTSATARQLALQGDDNDQPDHLPYALTDARKVVFAIPGLGVALMMLQTPIAMGALILLVGAYVVWAFWPKPRDPDDDSDTDAGTGSGADAHHPEHAEEVLR